MPYIKTEDRERLRVGVVPYTPGELNYLFTTICHRYLATIGEKYQTYNDIIGALENCKLEIYRRKVSDYEDTKIKENGDV